MTDITRITVAAALVGPEYEVTGPCDIILKDDRIAEITPLSRPFDGPRLLAMPALADAHNHARPLSTTSFGCGGKPLESWLPNLAVMPSVDAYTAAAASFARSLRGGVTSVMVHLTRAMGLVPLAEEAQQISKAAADVGISIGFAVSMRDRNPLVYGDHTALLDGLPADVAALVRQKWLGPLPDVDQQLALVDEVAEAVAGLPGHIDIQYGPTGVQWCSDALLRAVAARSAQTGRRVHMHLLETKPQRVWADRTYSDGVVRHLDDIGLLSPRLTLAHCVWARPDELTRIAGSGARIAVNASSNLHLHSGIAPVADMLASGVSVAMGLDGCAFDEDDDALRELRLFHLLNHGRGFDTDWLTRQTAMRAACVTGRAGLGLGAGGILETGLPGDLLLLDLDALDRDAVMDVDPRDYVFARAGQSHIAAAYSKGRKVLENGTVLGVDLPQLESNLREIYRAAIPSTAPLRAAWPRIESAISDYYKGCC